MSTAAAIVKQLAALGNEQAALQLQRFFKTGKGQYAEGDRFLGITVPVSRRVVRQYTDLPHAEIRKLLRSPYHEARLVALLIMVRAHQRGGHATRDRLHRLYLANTKYINNWDLVDLSAEHVVGSHLGPGRHALLTQLAKSPVLWERRIAMLATFHFIKQGYFTETTRLARILLNDEHDLIHKAVGWMLREVGKRDSGTEEEFLARHGRAMPRTMLRYAIEKFPPALRQKYMAR
jgi:3-methyladenine DNA glycosylase AlkD